MVEESEERLSEEQIEELIQTLAQVLPGDPEQENAAPADAEMEEDGEQSWAARTESTTKLNNKKSLDAHRTQRMKAKQKQRAQSGENVFGWNAQNKICAVYFVFVCFLKIFVTWLWLNGRHLQTGCKLFCI